jgi:hypothetical protein
MEIITTSDLPKALMAFKLQDGNILYIHNDDVKGIAMRIVTEASLAMTKIVEHCIQSKNSIDQIQEIIAKYPDMDKNLQNQYHELMLELLKNKTNAPAWPLVK